MIKLRQDRQSKHSHLETVITVHKNSKISPWLVTQLAGAVSHVPKVVGLIPSQGTYLGCSLIPGQAHTEAAN